MNAEAMTARESHIVLDPTPTRDGVLMINITEDMASWVIRLTPANAAKLGHRLILAAEAVQLPNAPERP